MKRFVGIFMLLSALFILNGCRSVEEHTFSNEEYELENDEITISGLDNFSERELKIPSDIDGYPVRTIGEDAFKDNETIESVHIPSSVKTIGVSAFEKAYKLQEVHFKDDSQLNIIEAHAFDNARDLRAIDLPKTLHTIGDGAFKNTDHLPRIDIPSSVKSMGESVFDSQNMHYANRSHDLITIRTAHESKPSNWDSNWNNSKASVIWGYQETKENDTFVYTLNSNDTISILGRSEPSFWQRSKAVDLVIPTHIDDKPVTQIARGAFENDENLLSVAIPNTVKGIPYSAFSDAANLHTVIFEENAQISYIGGNAFRNAERLKRIDIPRNVTTIDSGAFYGASSLEAVNFTKNSELTRIGPAAFARPKELSHIEIPANVTTIKSAAFQTTGLESIDFEKDSQLKTIERFAFNVNQDLQSIDLPGHVTHIGENAFSSTGITHIKFPEAVKTIGPRAFQNAPIDSVIIPKSVETLGEKVFYDNNKLAIYVEHDQKPGEWDDNWNHKDRPVTWGYEKE